MFYHDRARQQNLFSRIEFHFNLEKASIIWFSVKCLKVLSSRFHLHMYCNASEKNPELVIPDYVQKFFFLSITIGACIVFQWQQECLASVLKLINEFATEEALCESSGDLDEVFDEPASSSSSSSGEEIPRKRARTARSRKDSTDSGRLNVRFSSVSFSICSFSKFVKILKLNHICRARC